MFYCKCLVLSSLSKVDFFENKNSGRVGWIKVNLTLWRELSEVFAVVCSNKNQKNVTGWSFTSINIVFVTYKATFGEQTMILLLMFLDFGLWSWSASFYSLVRKLGFISQPSSKSTLPLVGLQNIHATMPTTRLEHFISSFCPLLLIQLNDEWKIVSSVRGLRLWAQGLSIKIPLP